MKRSLTILVSAMTVLAALSSTVYADTLEDLDKALAAATAWKHGDDANVMKTLESVTFAAGNDAKLRGPVEDKLLAALKSSKSVDTRRFICRQLRTIGTVKSVPVLASLLGDAELSHGARYALGRIEDPKAAAALHNAMGRNKGKIQAGIIITLAKRGYTAAMGDMVKLFGSSDKDVAQAAIRGVGILGTSAGAKALLGARTSGKLRTRITDALLDCAEQLTRSGKASDATLIYKVLYTPKEATHVRLAALRGLARSQGAQAASTLAAVIKGDDPQMRASAIAFMTDVKDPSATKTLVSLLATMKPDGQTLILRSLGARGDKSACPAVTKAAASEDKNVRAAALEALGSVGGAGSVDLLVKSATTEQVARGSLLVIKGDGVEANIIKAISAGETKARIEAIRAVKARGCKQAVSALFKAARDADSGVRKESVSALGALAGEKDIGGLLAILVKPADPKERSGIEHAVGVAFLSVSDKKKAAEKIFTAMRSASGDAKASLIRLLVQTPTTKAVSALEFSVKDPNASISDAAVRTLAAWPNATPADAVIALAKSTSNKTHRVLLLRGYVRMAALTKDPTDMCLRAMKLAQTTQDKKLVLSGFGAAGSMEAFNTVAKYLDDKNTREEAAMAAAKIGDKLRGSKDRLQVKFILQKVVKVTKNRNTKRMAEKTIRGIKK
ncbi:MAG: HEAT repeat domain-containing protein [Phycisphaerae bacterium]|jgi:HEAT repeat protein|nr:HEAT repeat domain-containing protein [Phycisphaerae bacterium]